MYAWMSFMNVFRNNINNDFQNSSFSSHYSLVAMVQMTGNGGVV